MLVLVPSVGGPAAFEQHLSAERLKAIQNELTESGMILVLPKFTCQSDSVSLGRMLTRLGMADAFKPGS